MIQRDIFWTPVTLEKYSSVTGPSHAGNQPSSLLKTGGVDPFEGTSFTVRLAHFLSVAPLRLGKLTASSVKLHCGGGAWFGSAAEGTGWGSGSGNGAGRRCNWPQLHLVELIVSHPFKCSRGDLASGDLGQTSKYGPVRTLNKEKHPNVRMCLCLPKSYCHFT